MKLMRSIAAPALAAGILLSALTGCASPSSRTIETVPPTAATGTPTPTATPTKTTTPTPTGSSSQSLRDGCVLVAGEITDVSKAISEAGSKLSAQDFAGAGAILKPAIDKMTAATPKITNPDVKKVWTDLLSAYTDYSKSITSIDPKNSSTLTAMQNALKRVTDTLQTFSKVCSG